MAASLADGQLSTILCRAAHERLSKPDACPTELTNISLAGRGWHVEKPLDDLVKGGTPFRAAPPSTPSHR